MDQIQHICSDAITELDQATFEGLGCLEHGLVVLQGADSWGAHERGFIELPCAEGTLTIALAYDEREAPYAVRPDGCEIRELLLSLTDEDDFIACAWARVDENTPLLGVGVDLCGAKRFRERPGAKRRDLAELLLTPRERDLVSDISLEQPLYAKAALFAAKEAGFKATAAPLRRWYDTHEEELRYEVRHFVMEDVGIERGTGRNGAAQAAMDAMGIKRVRVRWAQVEGMALVTAVSLCSWDDHQV